MGKVYTHCEQSPAPSNLIKGTSHSLTAAQARGGQAKPQISCTLSSSAPSHLAPGNKQNNLR